MGIRLILNKYQEIMYIKIQGVSFSGGWRGIGGWVYNRVNHVASRIMESI